MLSFWYEVGEACSYQGRNIFDGRIKSAAGLAGAKIMTSWEYPTRDSDKATREDSLASMRTVDSD